MCAHKDSLYRLDAENACVRFCWIIALVLLNDFHHSDTVPTPLPTPTLTHAPHPVTPLHPPPTHTYLYIHSLTSTPSTCVPFLHRTPQMTSSCSRMLQRTTSLSSSLRSQRSKPHCPTCCVCCRYTHACRHWRDVCIYALKGVNGFHSYYCSAAW